MKKNPFDVMFAFLGGEEKGKPGGWAVGYNVKLWEMNWALLDLRGKKRPWRVQEFKRSLYTGDVQLLGRPRFFKTRIAAEQAILKMDEAFQKAREEKHGPASEESSTPAQRDLANARIKVVKKWFPDTIAVQEQTGQTQEHSQALRKALAIDMARLKRPFAPEILAGVLFDPDFMSVLAKAQTSSNPLDPMEEELALNWVAKYSGEGDGSYPSTMKEATGTCYTSSAIKKRAQRLGLTVSSSKKSGQIT